MKIIQHKLKSNGHFSIIREPYPHKQHSNQQCGLDIYIDVLDHDTGNINHVKLYENKKGRYFKKDGSWYLTGFTQEYWYVPYQIEKID